MTLPKNPTEGDKIKCPDCDAPITARLKTYKDNKYPSYIQWQNATENKAHKDKDGNCPTDDESQKVHTQESIVESNTSHSGATAGPPNLTTVTIPKEKVPEIDPTLKSQIEGETLIQYQIHLVIKNFLEKFENNPNGGMIGQFTKHCYDKFVKVEFKKASEV